MASGLSIYTANLINEYWLRGGSTPTPPASYWIALFTTGAATNLRNDNLAAAVANEPSGGAYARLEIRGSTGRVFAASSAGLCENTASWAFTAASGSWGVITTAALVDVSSGSSGHVWYYGDLVSSKSVTTPDIFRFLTGTFDIQL